MALINEKWVNITEATSILNLSVSTIRRRIKNKDKTLKYKKQGGVYLIQVPDTQTENIKNEEVVKETNLVDVLVKQLEEKDRLIRDLNERIKEAHILASGKPEEQEQDSGEIIYTTGQVEQERENVDSKPTKDKKQIWKNILYVVVLLATFGLIGFMLYQQGIITF